MMTTAWLLSGECTDQALADSPLQSLDSKGEDEVLSSVAQDMSVEEKPVERSSPTANGLLAWRGIELKGRVFVRATIMRDNTVNQGMIVREGWSSQLALTSARISARYRDRNRRVRLRITAEMESGEAKIRDAYIRWRPNRYFRVWAGRMRRPISVITLTSRWVLPVVERGILNDLQLGNANTDAPDTLQLNRTMAVQLQLRNRDLPAEPRFTVGIYRSEVHEQLAEALGLNRVPIDASKHFPEDIYARLEVEPIPEIRTGITGAWLVRLENAGTRDTLSHGFLGAIDLAVEYDHLRIWAEGFLGNSPFHLGNDFVSRSYFLAARAIVALQIESGIGLVEPYITGQVLDASGAFSDDVAWQGGGGINLRIAEIWRLQLAVDAMTAGTLLLCDDAMNFIAQVGARW